MHKKKQQTIAFLFAIKRKAKGSSTYLIIPMAFLICIILFYVSIYMRATDTISDNLKTSVDGANLSASLINVDAMLHNGTLQILGCVKDGNITSKEKDMVKKRFESYQIALKSNVGLDNDFNFKGGTCGWAANLIASGSLKIDTFIIYDIADDTIDGQGKTVANVWSYTISNIEKYTTSPTITKSLNPVGIITRNSDGKVIKSTAKTPEGVLITDPTVYSEVSFPIRPPAIANSDFINQNSLSGNIELKDFLDGNRRVKRIASTSVKIGDEDENAFGDLNGNGWFDN